MIPDPRTALLVSLLGVAAALASWRGALAALAALGLEAVLAGASPRALALRLLPLASGFAFFLLFLPFAPGPVLDVGLRGLAVSTSPVVLGVVASWSGVVAALQGLGLPRPAMAFLVILGRHAAGVAEDARQAHHALVTRGGYDGARNLGRSTAILLPRVLDRALHRADHVAHALELRGFRGRVPGLPAFRPRTGEAAHYALALLLGLAAAYEAGPWSH
jgi:energy-coupling factor transporter transmembrane protein EcfT